MGKNRVIDYTFKKDDNHVSVPITQDDDDIFYDALDHIPTARNYSTGYAVVMGAGIGYFTGYGIILGIILPTIDEILIRNGYEKEHWISKAALSAAWFGMPMSALSAYIGYTANTIAIVGSAVITKFSNDIFDQSENISQIVKGTGILQEILDPEQKISSKELFKIISTIGSHPINASNMLKEDIAYLMHNKLAQNIALHITKGAITVGLDQLYMSYTGVATGGSPNALNFILSTIGSNTETPDYYDVISTVALHSGLYIAKNCLQSLISVYASNKDQMFAVYLENIVRDKVYDKDNIITNRDKDGLRHDDIITNSTNDITQTLQWSIIRLNTMINKCAATPGSLSIICNNGHTIVLSIHMVQANIINKINDWVIAHTPDTSHLDTHITRIKSASLTNFRDIVCSNSDKMVTSKLNELLQEKNAIAVSSKLFSSVRDNINPITTLFFTCCDAIFFLQKIVAGDMSVSQAPIILQNIDMFTSGTGKFTVQAEEKQQQRLKILFSKKQPNVELRNIEIDESSNNIEFTSYSLKTHNKIFIKIDHIKFTHGYNVINAPSGAGKSSILQDMIYPLSGNMICTGNVKLPCKTENIIYISQKGFLLPSGVASIFESITSQHASKMDRSKKDTIKKQILLLAEKIELSLDESKLFAQEYNLSGGEGKKVCIIKAIFQSIECANQGITPVVILDEPFNELDERSVQLSERALKQYIPRKTIVIIVDHNLKHNNHTLDDNSYFYDSAFALDDSGSTHVEYYNEHVQLVGEV